jgi:hypothetical protein
MCRKMNKKNPTLKIETIYHRSNMSSLLMFNYGDKDHFPERLPQPPVSMMRAQASLQDGCVNRLPLIAFQ